MTTRHLVLLAVLLGLILPAHVVCPQNAVQPAGDAVSKGKPATAPPGAKPDAQKADEKAEDERVTVEHADNFRYDSATKTYHMSGSVVFVNKDMRLCCDQADYNEEADTARATGHLRATDPSSVVTGDLMEADFGKKLAIVTGNVQVVTQKKSNQASGEKATALQRKSKPRGGEKGEANAAPKPDRVAVAGKSKRSNEPERIEDYWEEKTIITCERLEYYYADDVKKMIATPRVKAVQEKRTVWADQAVYEDIARIVTLTGNVLLKTTDGDEMQCTKAVVSLDEDWVQAENMKGMTLRRGKGESGKPAAGTKPTEGAKPTTGAAPAEDGKPAAGEEATPAKEKPPAPAPQKPEG